MRFLFVMGLLTLSVAASAQRTPLAESVREQLLQTEARSFQLARVVSSHLDRARTAVRRQRARCYDQILSQVHALARQAGYRAGVVGDAAERHALLSQRLGERLDRLRLDARRCQGPRLREGTVVTVEIADWVPR